MDFIKTHRQKMILSGLAVGALGWWYCSDLASKEHHPSTIVSPRGNLSEYFQNKKGMWIYTKSWIPSSSIIGLVFIVHGHGEHISRPGYEYLAKQLVQQDYAVFGLDHQGHGKSNGSRGHVRMISDLCEDFEAFVQQKTEEYPDVPAFAIGHSMGGCILLSTSVRCQNLFKGIILSAPAACTHVDPLFSDAIRFIGHSLASVFPKLQVIRLPLNTGLSRSQAAVDAYLKDPLINKGYINLCTADAIINECKQLWDKVNLIQIPVFIIHGDADTIVHPTGAELLFNRIGAIDKKILVPVGVKHEPWEDPSRDEFIEEITKWIQKRT